MINTFFLSFKIDPYLFKKKKKTLVEVVNSPILFLLTTYKIVIHENTQHFINNVCCQKQVWLFNDHRVIRYVKKKNYLHVS